MLLFHPLAFNIPLDIRSSLIFATPSDPTPSESSGFPLSSSGYQSFLPHRWSVLLTIWPAHCHISLQILRAMLVTFVRQWISSFRNLSRREIHIVSHRRHPSQRRRSTLATQTAQTLLTSGNETALILT